MKNFGAGYTSEPNIDNTTNNTAAGSGILGVLCSYPGYYKNEDGQLDTTKYLQDGYYYQQFSYVLKVNESLSTYKEALKTLVHPLGLQLFGQVSDQTHIKLKAKILNESLGSQVSISISNIINNKI